MQTAARRPSPSASSPHRPVAVAPTPKFPSLQDDGLLPHSEDAIIDGDHHPSHPVLLPNGGRTGLDSWLPRKTAPNGASQHTGRRPRQKSLSEALRTIHNRRASMSENAHEIAEALKAPVSPKLIALCGLWYMTSIFTNASSKSILIAFRYPVTLTVVQFAFVSGLCILSSFFAHVFPSLQTMIPALKYKIQRPSRDLIVTTLPLTAFQIGGHILNSDAMSRIPVSLVHTIKGLSPLFTVLAYRFIFNIRYSTPTYLSLVPLTFGVIMACSANVSGDFIGLLLALGSALLFVTQNIVSKRLFNEAARAESEGTSTFTSAKKPDKLNLLCYSSGLALLFTLPIWVGSEAFPLFRNFYQNGGIELSKRPDALDHDRLIIEFIFNGVFHYAQSLVAFVLLSMVSPVTYSVASLIKRVFVICFAIVWFGNPMTKIQGLGILLTFLGLYLYDRTKDSSKADRRAKLLHPQGDQPLLPLIAEEKRNDRLLPQSGSSANGLGHGAAGSPYGNGRRSPASSGYWLPPGTKAAETWTTTNDASRGNSIST